MGFTVASPCCCQCHQYACARTRTEEIAARVLKVELVTKPAEPSRIQLVTAAEQGVAGAGSTTRVSPNDRLKDGQFRREPGRRDPTRLPIPTARQLWTTCANGTIKRPLTGDHQANVRFHRPQAGISPLQHDFYRLEVGFYPHGEQPRFRYAKYANSETWCEKRSDGTDQCRACKVECFFDRVLYPSHDWRKRYACRNRLGKRHDSGGLRPPVAGVVPVRRSISSRTTAARPLSSAI